jgi:hypothetical protein
LPISPCTKTAKHSIFCLSDAPRGTGTGNSPARLYAAAPAAWPLQRLAGRARRALARAKTTARRGGRLARLRRSAPCGAARRPVDRSRFSRRNKSKAQAAGADLSRRKDGRELKAAQHSAGCVCSLWEKATRTRYSVQARLAAVAWGASAMDSNATLQHCAVAIPQRPVDVGGWFGPRKGGLLCAAESLAHLGPPEQTAGRAK